MMRLGTFPPTSKRPLSLPKRVILTGVFAIVAYWWVTYPDHSWRQKMNIEVEVAGAAVSGSSVVGVVWRNNYFNARYATAPSWVQEIIGEAPFVALPDGRSMFAVLSSANDLEYTGNIAGRVLLGRKGRVWGNNEFDAIRRSEETIVLPVENYPLLVTFGDINDPTTVRRVDPDNLAATFGPGVSLKRITLEITDDEVTQEKIGSVLRWLATIGDGMLDGKHMSTLQAENRLANDLSRLDFLRK